MSQAEAPRTVAGAVRIAGWALALTLGFIQTWRSRHAMNPDGISYLDIADAYLAGDWAAAINAYWSPLYSWVLAAATLVARPSAYSEFTMVHLVTFGIYALSLCAFELLLTEVIRVRRDRGMDVARQTAVPNEEWAWRSIGYALFIWSGLSMINLTIVTPDTLVAALMYLSAALLLRLRDPDASNWLPVTLGLILGLGYLAKAAMMPLAFVFIGVAFVAWRIPRRLAVRRAILTLIGFAAVAAPYVVVLSDAKGKPTWGEVATLVYAWFVDDVALASHWQGDPPGRGTPVHPTRQLSETPAVYEFASPVAGSYPPWYDPSYWYEGIRPRLRPVRMLSRLSVYSLEYLRLMAPIVAVFGVLWWVSGRSEAGASSVRDFALVTVPAAAALLMYGVVFMEPRYVGPFLVLLSLGALAGLRTPVVGRSPSLLGGAAVGLSVVLVAPLAVALLLNAVVLVTRPELGGRSAHVQWQVAEALGAAGVRAGDAVAAMGDALPSYWARLARVKVVVEIRELDDANLFWASDSTGRARVVQLFARAGARVAVAKPLPAWARLGAWRPLGTTGYYVLDLGH